MCSLPVCKPVIHLLCFPPNVEEWNDHQNGTTLVPSVPLEDSRTFLKQKKARLGFMVQTINDSWVRSTNLSSMNFERQECRSAQEKLDNVVTQWSFAAVTKSRRENNAKYRIVLHDAFTRENKYNPKNGTWIDPSRFRSKIFSLWWILTACYELSVLQEYQSQMLSRTNKVCMSQGKKNFYEKLSQCPVNGMWRSPVAKSQPS
ncbi:hypothetical protein HNY73_017338 [Argiope bruennichi]|uniref:Uncharacterized protein n=1 Tax=Argiope bruennichi TaxID=94029 RepID=A0A8T0EQM2_ARGBR|nr:hypothetical protein HNY73_017338 [Argiope bruennichi]